MLLIAGLMLFIPLFVRDQRMLDYAHPATRLGLLLAAFSVAIPLSVFWFALPWAKVAAHLPGVGR
jgi:hypothetical protein